MLGLKNGFIAIIGGFRPLFKVPTSRGDHIKECIKRLDLCCIHLPLLGIVVYIEVGAYCLDPVVICVIIVSLFLCICVVFCVVVVLPVTVVVVVALSVVWK